MLDHLIGFTIAGSLILVAFATCGENTEKVFSTGCYAELAAVEEDMDQGAAEHCLATTNVNRFSTSIEARWKCRVLETGESGWLQTYTVRCYRPQGR